MEITRPRNEIEKDLKSGGFLDVRNWRQEDFKQKALIEIDDTDYAWRHKKHTPYSRTMALNHLSEKVAQIERRLKKARDLKETDVKIDLKIDWEQFGGFKLFDFVGEGDAMTTMITSGIKQPTKTGIFRDYVCKETGCKVTIFYSMDELEKEAQINDGSINKGKQSEAQNPLAKN